MFQTILLLSPIYTTFFWFIALSLNNKSRNPPKHFLGLFMLVASVVYISHFFYFTKQYCVYYYLDSIYTLAYLLVYPMYHKYVRLLTVDAELSAKKHFKFVAPPILIFLLTLLGYLLMSKEQGLSFITSVLVEGNKPVGMHRYMFLLFVAGRILFILQTLLYLALSFVLIRENNIKIKDYYSNIDERKLNWVQFFNICFAFTAVSSAVLASLGRNFFLQNDYLLLFPSVVFTVMLFIIGLMGSNQSAFFIEMANSKESLHEGKPILQLDYKLRSLFEKEKIYKNPDLKVWEVSSMLGTSINEITKTIKSEFKMNFCSFVNSYRLENAKQLINNNPNLTNEQIAELSGFLTPQSLDKEIQSAEKVSLTQFRKQT